MRYYLFFLLFFALVSHQPPIVVLITTYNNAALCCDNLEAALLQPYSNKHIIIVDDCSTDGTFEILHTYIVRHHLEEMVTLLRAPTHRGALHNMWHVIHQLPDDTIIVNYDGDDLLPANINVFERIVQEYDKNAWMTYGQYCNQSDHSIGICQPLPLSVLQQQHIRHYSWVTSHLRTFKAWLFKNIKLKDLIFDGAFYTASLDLACMFPMIEMAGTHCHYIDDILYLYNDHNSASDGRIRGDLQQALGYFIRFKNKYPQLTHPRIIAQHPECLVIQLSNLSKDSLASFIGHHAYYVLDTPKSQQLLDIINSFTGKWICLLDAEAPLPTYSLDTCLSTLEHTHAFGGYFFNPDLTALHPPLLALHAQCYVWKFQQGTGIWACPPVQASIHSKELLVQALSYTESLEQAFKHIRIFDDIGICFTGE